MLCGIQIFFLHPTVSQIFRVSGFSGSKIFRVQGFLGSRFFWVQVFVGPSFSGSRF